MSGARAWCGALPLGLALLAGMMATAPVTAQEPPAPAEAQSTEEGSGQELPKGAGFNYRSRGFIDPFLSPHRAQRGVEEGGRPPGVRGMRVEEVFLKGIFDTPEGPVAMFQGSDGGRPALRRLPHRDRRARGYRLVPSGEPGPDRAATLP
jgi:hypothetical protein